MTLTCGQGEATGATDWEIKKKDSAAAVKEKNTDKAITLTYNKNNLGSGVYTCVAHTATESATSNAIELKDEHAGTP